MRRRRSEAATAFTYAWWLLGDERRAEDAVRRAAASEAVVTAPVEQRLVALLAEIRGSCVGVPTMCPASELTLLHDTQHLELEDAAALVGIDPAEARTELAHGRLEALLETVRADFTHPERLGGLATGNPADVAHARQCPDCGRARALLDQARKDLAAIPTISPPPGLASAMEARQPLDHGAPAGHGDEDHDERDALIEDEVDRGMLVAGGVFALLLVVLVSVLVARRSEAPLAEGGATPAVTAPDEAPVDEEPAGDPVATPDQTAPGDPGSGTPGDPDAGDFAITSAGVLVDDAAEPLPPGSQLAPDEAFRLVVRYTGASGGVPLLGAWSVDGNAYRVLRVVLSGNRSTHVFGAAVPPEGWPRGDHEVVLTVDGEPLETITFTVV